MIAFLLLLGLLTPASPGERLVLLGTAGGPTPKRTRAAPAQALVIGDAVYVVDCGNGVGRQMVLAGLPLRGLRHVFLNHHHSDHAADLVTLPLLAWAAGLDTELALHGPPPLRRSVEAGLRAASFDIATRVTDESRGPLGDLVRVPEFRSDGIVHKDAQVTVPAAWGARAPRRGRPRAPQSVRGRGSLGGSPAREQAMRPPPPSALFPLPAPAPPAPPACDPARARASASAPPQGGVVLLELEAEAA